MEGKTMGQGMSDYFLVHKFFVFFLKNIFNINSKAFCNIFAEDVAYQSLHLFYSPGGCTRFMNAEQAA